MPPFGPRLYLVKIAVRHSARRQTRCRHTLLHDFVIVNSIPDIDIGFKGNVCDGRVEIKYIGRRGGCL